MEVVCTCLDNSVPKCAVDFSVLLGKVVCMFESRIVVAGVMCPDHRYLIYTRWCIPHCGQAKIEARSQLVIILRS